MRTFKKHFKELFARQLFQKKEADGYVCTQKTRSTAVWCSEQLGVRQSGVVSNSEKSGTPTDVAA